MDLSSGQQWAMYVWAAAVAIAVMVGIWYGTNRRGTRPGLPPEHVAAAALLGFFGWEMLVNLPASIIGLWSLTAGLGEARGAEGQQAFVLGQVAFVVGAAMAIAGILRRRTWGIALGIGLAAALVVSTVVNNAWILASLGQSMGFDSYISIVTSAIGRGVPALAVIGLLAWPLVRRSTSRAVSPRSNGDWSATAASEAPR